MTTRRITVIGDVLLDRDIDGTATRLCPDAPAPVVDVAAVTGNPGGAGLAALLCRHDPLPASVRLVLPLAQDPVADELLAGLGDLDVVSLGHEGPTRQKTRLRVAGRSVARVDTGGPGRPLDVDIDTVEAALRDADVVLVSDYGAGLTRDPQIRAALSRHATRGRMLWDPHPRGGDPVAGVTLVSPNESEARQVLGTRADAIAEDLVAAEVRAAWRAQAVAVTCGRRGVFLATPESSSYIPVGALSQLYDTCGAGDAFAAAAAVAMAHGATTTEAVRRAAALSCEWVAGGGLHEFRRTVLGSTADPAPGSWAAAPRPGGRHGERTTADGGQQGAARRRRGSTLVATGGCFDVLHVGHLATLEAARRLGDELVVLLNSDASVRRLKGPARPTVPAHDRARMLRGLRCVDEVIVFEEDTPMAALARLRPDVWVKGGDYTPELLPETDQIRAWGGRVVVVPYLAGWSTTSLLSGRRG